MNWVMLGIESKTRRPTIKKAQVYTLKELADMEKEKSGSDKEKKHVEHYCEMKDMGLTPVEVAEIMNQQQNGEIILH